MMRIYQSDTGEWIATDDAGRKLRGATAGVVEAAYMDQQLKLDLISKLRTLTATATENYYQIDQLLRQMADHGLLPDVAAGETTPDDPIADADLTDTVHATITAAQIYDVAGRWQAIGAQFDRDTRRAFTALGKPAPQPRPNAPQVR